MFASHVTDFQPIDFQHNLIVVADDYMADDTGKSSITYFLKLKRKFHVNVVLIDNDGFIVVSKKKSLKGKTRRINDSASSYLENQEFDLECFIR